MTDQPCHHRPTGRTRRLPRRLAAVFVLFLLLAAACGSGVDSFDSATNASVAADSRGGAGADRAEAYEGEPAGDYEVVDAVEADFDDAPSGVTTTGAAGTEATAQLPDLGRDIIFTATLEIASTDVTEATRQAIRSIEARGGFLFSQETRGGSGGTSVLTFKVLPEHFQAALNDLGSVGDVRSQSISADDVSAVVVDLESRINTAEASVIRLRNLLDDASELETIATLENQLLQRETTLEQLRGQLRTVRNQVDLATITVYVTELLNRPGLAIDTMAYAGHDAGFGCFEAANIRSVEAGDPVTVCYRLTNVGDTPLVDVTLDDSALGASIGSVVVVDGTVTRIDPGETLLLAHEVELTEAVRVRTSVTATGLDTDGNPLEDEVRATAATMRFDVLEVDDGIPSFGEVLSDSWDTLVTAAIVVALVAVAIAPFVAALLVIGTPVWFWMRRRNARATSRPPRPTPPAPAPPSASGEGDVGVGEEAAITG